jgi:glyoxylase-like metal-dependent hydrolase (beta-lactamase superfamily II)
VIFEQFYLSCLAHASYLIGSEGIAAVVDPQRDVGIYLETAQQHGLRIAYIIETHLHADFVSGHQELAQRTGATICLGEGSGATVHCKSGYRSAIACSLLQAYGFGRVMNVLGGLDAWIVSSAGGKTAGAT